MLKECQPKFAEIVMNFWDNSAKFDESLSSTELCVKFQVKLVQWSLHFSIAFVTNQ